MSFGIEIPGCLNHPPEDQACLIVPIGLYGGVNKVTPICNGPHFQKPRLVRENPKNHPITEAVRDCLGGVEKMHQYPLDNRRLVGLVPTGSAATITLSHGDRQNTVTIYDYKDTRHAEATIGHHTHTLDAYDYPIPLRVGSEIAAYLFYIDRESARIMDSLPDANYT